MVNISSTDKDSFGHLCPILAYLNLVGILIQSDSIYQYQSQHKYCNDRNGIFQNSRVMQNTTGILGSVLSPPSNGATRGDDNKNKV